MLAILITGIIPSRTFLQNQSGNISASVSTKFQRVATGENSHTGHARERENHDAETLIRSPCNVGSVRQSPPPQYL